ncbi:uncharacterized protein N7483_003601 [Penicillium malachiteum]|uniref:uncharacterized protein n=1 Tax=Penicillium malachiteum TaxID=1324776 RepID=UPI002547EFD6|nr:uncharacterized protein N7483_003601 [Penicillium malachiteum]KAJ5729093.1 hypothetical protein N7483_003601 [Penicillium malachiteum]
MAQATYAIQGIPLPTEHPNPPSRKEVTAWINDPNNSRQVSLFMRALTEFQKLSPTQDRLSYYRIAGIHGNPDVSWDGVGNPPGLTGWWCAHNKETFVTWHRPYLALFEQRIYDTMLTIIVRDIPENKRGLWKDAAKEWRLPYWDWASKQAYINDYGLPQIFTKERIDILDIVNDDPPTMVNIINPLSRFANPTGVAMGDKKMGEFSLVGTPWDKAIATSRWGIDLTKPAARWMNGINNWNDANKAIQGGSGITTIEDEVYRLFATNFSSWESFESTKFHADTNNDYLSLEFVHNVIHGATGGGNGRLGHMADPSVAAFDPIFWFHHCNIDRLAAIFQTLHPAMWYSPTTGIGAAKLDPFHRDTTGASWSSDECRDWKTSLKYNYDDLSVQVSPVGSARLFALTPGATSDRQMDVQDDLSVLRMKINEKYGTLRREIQRASDIIGRENDYTINVEYDRYALDGASYYIRFFLGIPPSEVESFARPETYIGSMFTFSSTLEGTRNTVQCHNCLEQKREGVLSTAQIPITKAILDLAKDPGKPDFRTMEPEEVETYLETNLTWRAVIAIEVSHSTSPPYL